MIMMPYFVVLLIAFYGLVLQAHQKNTLSLIDAIKTTDLATVQKQFDAGHLDAEHIHSQNEYGETALMWAAFKGYNEIVKLLLEAHVDLHAINDYGDTALIWATFAGNREAITMLLEAGADPNFKGGGGDVPLIFASYKGDIKTVKLLLKAGANPYSVNDNGETPFMLASLNGHVDIVRLFEAHKP